LQIVDVSTPGSPVVVGEVALPGAGVIRGVSVADSYAYVAAGDVDVWTDTEGASIYCYGSVLDNLTSDPTTVLPQ